MLENANNGDLFIIDEDDISDEDNYFKNDVIRFERMLDHGHALFSNDRIDHYFIIYPNQESHLKPYRPSKK